ncbi:putative histidine kinase/HSP90-like ATPase superfamily [Helianthus debilis subsp. tardiflorus]
MASAKEHVEEIRRMKFSIGGETNPLTEDLHQAVKNLSAELYAKDVHVLMELIQNAEDNEYPEGVDPTLEFVITSKDITNTGAPATLLVFNNERGFSPKNVESICSVGRSTKKGLRKRGYIGEKGIGFKSVFLITSQPYIFSNGYKIRFNEKPCQQCNVGYIVPEWVEEDPTLFDIQSVYGLSTALPTTTLVLPLKSEKVKPVKDQLSTIHPEVLLFLSKIKRLSVREDNDDPRLNTVSAISISSEKNFVTLKSMDAEENVFSILKFIQYLGAHYIPSTDFVNQIKQGKWVRTSQGYMTPNNSVLSSNEWKAASQISKIPFIDKDYYGEEILSFKKELERLGVIVNFDESCYQLVSDNLKSSSSLTSLSSEAMLLLLRCIKKLRSSDKLVQAVKNKKCVKTNLGFRRPSECFLVTSEAKWGCLLHVFGSFPILDANFYGHSIFSMDKELKKIGVMVDFEDAAKEFTSIFKQQASASSIRKENVFSFLECYRKLKKKFPEELKKCIREEKWLKTKLGDYKRPNECLLFCSDWNAFLKRDDGPFIDEQFYGSRIKSYREELNHLGVITGINKGCQVIASYLNSQSNFEKINRLYNYLSEFKWEPADDDDDKKIWLPRGADNGEWVSPQDCVLHDKNNLFGGLLYVLDKYKYERKILGFFADIFNVKFHPSVDDYCNLWKKWEASGNQITHSECCAFWEFVVKNWNLKTEETFNQSFSKLPVSSSSSDGIFLSDKRDVFIGDDLFLTDLFQSCSRPTFVWYPQPSSKTLTRTKLVDIFNKLGVRTISESAQKTLSDVDQLKLAPISSKEKFRKKGLVKLILGFLADPNLNLETERRHEAVSRMLGLEAFETADPMIVKYSLSLSCGDVVTVEDKRMIRWDKQNSKLFVQKREEGGCQKSRIEHADHFGEVIAEGMLWENEEVMPQLSELIRLGYLVEFDEEAIDFLMKKKNLQIFVDDRQYLCSIFSS